MNKKSWKCSFCGDTIELYDCGATIVKYNGTVCVLDKIQYKLMDKTQRSLIVVCPTCLHQLKTSLAEIEFPNINEV